MTGCCIDGYNNSTNKGFSMRSFPTNHERRALWITNINILNWKPTKNSRICEVRLSSDAVASRRQVHKELIKNWIRALRVTVLNAALPSSLSGILRLNDVHKLSIEIFQKLKP